MSTSRLPPRPWAALLLASSLGCVSILGMRTAHADDVRLKNGMTLHGIATEIETLALTPKKVPSGPTNLTPVLLVATPLSRYFIPRLQKDSIAEGADLGRHEGFKLPQIKQRGGTRILGAMQGYLEKPEWFDDFGHRKVLINVAGGDEWIYQGVKEITPRYLKVIGLNIGWETAIATSSVPVEVLDAMMRRACNPKNPQDLTPVDRINIARFYIDAAMYEPANRELLAIRSNYPEMSDTVALVQAHLMEAQANDLLSELRLRRAAGQHRFVIDAAKQFPAENVSAGVLREVREIGGDYAKAHERAEQIVAQLGELQGQIKDKNRVAEIAPLRAEIVEKLNYSNLDRLDAFFNLAGDAQLKPEEKLALAFSGWISGSAGAVTELDAALRFWQARYLLVEYFRTAPDDETGRKTILTKLEALEGIGPERIAQLIPFLPPVLEPAGAEPGNAVKIDLGATEQEQKRAYWVSLPLEYDPSRSYPMIVALHDGARPYESGTPQQELQGFWGGGEDKPRDSQRHGYIVIAPEYVTKEDTKGYDYSAKPHQIVIDSIRDARRRFSVDSDRVFLSGHGMGGDAAWDIGLSHPDLFAGIIPISGAIDRYAKYYIENGRMLGIYSISGELDHDLLNRNANSYMRMITPLNLDFIYCEYNGAGPDSFYSEIHLLFDWMSKQRRQEIPKQINIKTLRETDNQFYWLEFSKLPSAQTGINWSAKKPQAVHPLNVAARITPGNTIQITPAPAENYRIWLPRGDGLIDFNKRVTVRIKATQQFHDFVKPDVSAMLEHVRIHGDRQQLYWAVLEF